MKILIKDTTMEERMRIVEQAFVISLTGAEKPSQEVIDLVNEYIEGKKELEEIRKIVLAKYQKEGEQQ